MSQTGAVGGAMQPTLEPARPKEPRFPALRNLLVVLVGIAVILAGLGSVEYLYRGFTDGVASGRVHYCGRTYFAGTWKGWSLAQVRAYEATGLASGQSPYPLVQVGTAPWIFGDPVYAAVQPGSKPPPGGACTLWVWVKTGPDSYDSFDLAGGP